MSKSMKRRRFEELFAPHEDVLSCIFNQLDLRDCIRMGAVCKSWLSVSKWSIITRSPQLPWLMILPNFNSESWCNIRARSQLSWRMRLFNPNSNPIPAEIEEENSLTKEEKELRCFLSISDNTIYDNIKFPEISGKRCCGSFHNAGARGWLMFINDDNLEMQLFHPWRRIQLQLPHHSTLQRERPFIDRSRNPLVVELKIRKSAMSDDESLLVVIHDFWYLGFWRKGDKVWTRISSERVCDVIYHKGKFYALSPMGSVGVVRFDTHKAYLEIITENIELDHYQPLYLVADSVSESFFIFVRKCLVLPEAIEEAYVFRKTWDFKVYELGVEKTGEYKKNPVKVKSLGERIIFLGQNSTFIAMANQFPGFKGNCVYYTDDYMESHLFQSPIGCVDMGIFNMEDKTIKLGFLNRLHYTFSPPVWILPPVYNVKGKI